MLQFNDLGLADREWLSPMLSATGRMGSEYAFGTLFLWRDTFFAKVCPAGHCTFFSYGEKYHTYKSPVSNDNFIEIMQALLADAKERQIPFRMWGATQEEVKLLETAFPGRFRFEADRNNADYIYKAEDLISLSGRKFHGKRNHIAQFDRSYDWSYEDLSPENLEDCRTVARLWNEEHEQAGNDGETLAMARALEHFESLRLDGGMIRIEGKPVAFTVGEEINPKTYLIHFEKALDGYEGLYAAINHEYAKRNLGSYEYINREEDMGIEGLRRAKLSYKPAFLLDKYYVSEKTVEEDQEAEK